MAASVVRRIISFRQEFFAPILFRRCVHRSSFSQKSNGVDLLSQDSLDKRTQQRQFRLKVKHERHGPTNRLTTVVAEFSSDVASGNIAAEEISWEDISPVLSKRKNFPGLQELDTEDAAADSREGSETMLVLDRIDRSSTTDKISAYFSAMGIGRSREACSPHVFGLEFTSFARKVRLLCEAGLTEQEACQLAVSFSVVQLPEYCVDCLRVLRKHGISIREMAKNDRQGTLAVLSMRSSQLERNIRYLKRAGLEAADIERIKLVMLLSPLEDTVMQRIERLKNTSVSSGQLQFLLNSACSSQTTMCSLEEAPAIVELTCLVKELNLSSSLIDIRALQAADVSKLRLNAMELTCSPLFIMPKVLDLLLHREESRTILLKSNPEDLCRHVRSLMALSDDPSMANIVQLKLRERPSLLNPAMDIEKHSRLLKGFFPSSCQKMALLFRQHAYLFTLTEEEIRDRIKLCEDVPSLTTEKMLQINQVNLLGKAFKDISLDKLCRLFVEFAESSSFQDILISAHPLSHGVVDANVRAR